MSTKVFVGNLSYNSTEGELQQAFSSAGQVVSARIITDRETGRSRGFAFVEFASSEEAEEAVRVMNDQELGGRRLRVNLAQERPPRAGGRGGFGGGPGGGGYGRPSGGFDDPRPAREPDFFGGGGFGGGGGGGGRPFGKPKGSRRGLRGRKRSLG